MIVQRRGRAARCLCRCLSLSAFLYAVLATIAPAFGSSSKRSRLDFTGPFVSIMTEEESRAWALMPYDADVTDFVGVFWARRDPTPGTARNEFREQFDRRVIYADLNFSESRKRTRTRGSMTDRGRIYILFGPPSKTALIQGASTIYNDPRQGFPTGMDAVPADARRGETWIWTYEGISALEIFASSTGKLEFEDQGSGAFRLLGRHLDLQSAEQKIIKAAITRPDLAWPPK